MKVHPEMEAGEGRGGKEKAPAAAEAAERNGNHRGQAKPTFGFSLSFRGRLIVRMDVMGMYSSW